MPFSAISEIKKIRGEEYINIYHDNRNKYSILVSESDGSVTSYSFSSPIYNATTRKLVDGLFTKDNNRYCCYGSNCTSVIDTDRIIMSNSVDKYTIGVADKVIAGDADTVAFSSFSVKPTLNGILISAESSERGLSLFVNMDKPYMNTRESSKAFSVMHEKFVPLMTVTPIGVTDSNGAVCAPCKLESARTSEQNFIVKITPLETLGCRMLIEVSMYDAKLMLDTTVDSANENENNAFGCIAFIGKSHGLGEQLLYSRIDNTKIGELLYKKINHAALHIPCIGGTEQTIDAYRVGRRFCSFGSSWSSRVSEAQKIGSLINRGDYKTLDLSKLIINPLNRQLLKTEGFILHASEESNGFSVLSTGDSATKPQVLEINYK